MIRNTGPGKRLLAAGIVLILGMTGCGTDNELSLTGTEETGIEVIIAGAGMAAHLPGGIAEPDRLPSAGVRNLREYVFLGVSRLSGDPERAYR